MAPQHSSFRSVKQTPATKRARDLRWQPAAKRSGWGFNLAQGSCRRQQGPPGPPETMPSGWSQGPCSMCRYSLLPAGQTVACRADSCGSTASPWQSSPWQDSTSCCTVRHTRGTKASCMTLRVAAAGAGAGAEDHEQLLVHASTLMLGRQLEQATPFSPSCNFSRQLSLTVAWYR